MEKVIYVLWRGARSDRAGWGPALRGALAQRLIELGAAGVQVNVCDDEAQGAAPTFHASRPAMDAFVSVWIDTANADRRRPFDDAVGELAERFAAYLVTESRPMVNTRFPPKPGARTAGFAQVALFQRPPRLSQQAWLEVWLGSHTQIAIDTQDTFLYVQNVVSRALTFDAPPYGAIVEEGFPPAAFGNLRAFYDASDDEAKFARHQAAMAKSCQRFIDFDKLDVVQTSQYVIKALG